MRVEGVGLRVESSGSKVTGHGERAQGKSGRTVDFHAVALHHFFDGGANVAQAHVDAALPDATVSGLLHRGEQRVIHGVECLSERAIDDPPFGIRVWGVGFESVGFESIGLESVGFENVGFEGVGV